jgi:dihydroorotate dehydrogenase (fumarate)
VAVKLSPFYTSLPGFATRLKDVGARGLVLFNRFYQPDVDLDTLDVDRRLVPSTPAELPLRLHALALLSGRIDLSLAASGGVHSGEDAAKAVLCGASAVQVVSALLDGGPERLAQIRDDLVAWLDGRGYKHLGEARGAMALDNVGAPEAWERLNYVRILQGWRPRPTGR